MEIEIDLERACELASEKARKETKKAFPSEWRTSEKAQIFWMKVYFFELMGLTNKFVRENTYTQPKQ